MHNDRDEIPAVGPDDLTECVTRARRRQRRKAAAQRRRRALRRRRATRARTVSKAPPLTRNST